MISVDDLAPDGLNAPLKMVLSPTSFMPNPDIGASRYRYTHDARHLDVLLVNKDSDTLVVSFHGAVNRAETFIPTFDRLVTVNSLEVSSMFFSDPGLWSDPNLKQAWFTGWTGFNIPYVAAQWIVKAAKEIGASKVVLSGSSGGAFAALQVSALIPHSIVVAYNAQTDIDEYQRFNSNHVDLQMYLKALWPNIYKELINDEKAELISWRDWIDDRFSASMRYSQKTSNRILSVQNKNDTNSIDDHNRFIDILDANKDASQHHSIVYSGDIDDSTPPNDVYLLGLEHAISWSKSARRIDHVQEFAGRQMGWHERISRRIWGQENGVPWSFENKLYLDDFCLEHEIPKPKIYETVATVADLYKIAKYDHAVIKPAELSSSIGVMVLDRRAADTYFDSMNRRLYTLDEIIEKQQLVANKWNVQSFVIEQRIRDIGQFPVPRDFKFYAFQGTVALIQCIDRNTGISRNSWFDGNFNPITDGSITHNAKYVTIASFAKPTMWKELLRFARNISENLRTGFARIDLFATPHGPRLGEVTLTPGGPYFRQHFMFSEELDTKLGKLWLQADDNVKEYNRGPM